MALSHTTRLPLQLYAKLIITIFMSHSIISSDNQLDYDVAVEQPIL